MSEPNERDSREAAAVRRGFDRRVADHRHRIAKRRLVARWRADLICPRFARCFSRGSSLPLRRPSRRSRVRQSTAWRGGRDSEGSTPRRPVERGGSGVNRCIYCGGRTPNVWTCAAHSDLPTSPYHLAEAFLREGNPQPFGSAGVTASLRSPRGTKSESRTGAALPLAPAPVPTKGV
jgi:hypothetical protein